MSDQHYGDQGKGYKVANLVENLTQTIEKTKEIENKEP